MTPVKWNHWRAKCAKDVVLNRAGHNLQMEQFKLYEALVHEWLDRVEEYTARHVDRFS